VTNGTYYAWRDRPETIEAIGGYGVGVNSMTAVRGGAEPVRLRVTAMTPSAFDILRARPLRGRLFTDDEVPAAGLSGVDTPRPVVISHALWQDCRTALGAQVRDIVALVLKHALAIALAGIGAGLWAAYTLTRYLSSFLYGVGPGDAVSYLLVSAAVAVVVTIACIVPARRAARVDPITVLRQA
jgi:hypothetical protein